MNKHSFSKAMKHVLTAACIGSFSLTLCATPVNVVASETAGYSIETENAKLSYVSSRMLDESVPSDDNGKDYVLIIYEYENYTVEPKEPWSDFYPTIYQNGVELDHLGSRNVNDTEDSQLLDDYFKSVIKGGKLRYGEAYELSDDSPLTVILKENGSQTVDPVSFEVNIGDEAGAVPAGDDQTQQETEAAQEQAETEAAAQTEAAEAPAMTAEELEAAILQQPVHVQSVDIQDASNYDVGWDCAVALPQIVNNSEDDIKDVEIYSYGWDSNNLPVSLRSKYISANTNATPHDIVFSEMSLLPGAVSNLDSGESFQCIPFDYNCNVAKIKCLVAGYRTYSGDTWSNPLAADFIRCYKDQKLVEPVVYTDQETVMKVQEALNAAGYDCGTPDGVAGAKTFAAMNAYQTDNGLLVKNDITDALLISLGLAEGTDSETSEEPSGEEAAEEAADEAAESGSADDIKTLIQGTWKKENTDKDTTMVFEGSTYKISEGDVTKFEGEYIIDTENQEVVLEIETADGPVGAHFTYTLDNGELTIHDKSGDYAKIA